MASIVAQPTAEPQPLPTPQLRDWLRRFPLLPDLRRAVERDPSSMLRVFVQLEQRNPQLARFMLEHADEIVQLLLTDLGRCSPVSPAEAG